MPPNGVIIVPPTPTDYIRGLTSPIPSQNLFVDWSSYLPSGELQRFSFDTLACVTFSALHCVATQINWMIASKKLSPFCISQLTDLGFIVDGKFEASDRFTAKMSGTTKQGNSMQNVWQSIRHDGLLPQKDYPNQVGSWDEFYQEIPQKLKDKAKRILDLLIVQWEWVIADPNGTNAFSLIREAVRHAPVQICTPVCPSWTSGTIHTCGDRQVAHCTMVYDVSYIKDVYEDLKKNIEH